MGASQSAEPITINNPAPPASPVSGNISPHVTLGAGCYWGTEKYIRKDFQKRFPNSVKSATVGFMNPDPNHKPNPSYREVCTGSTGHIEVLEVELYDPNAHYEELLRFFFMFHDPTTKNRQGNDVGSQYSSHIFTYDDKQASIAKKVVGQIQDSMSRGTLSNYEGSAVKTQITPATKFYPAEASHQDYLAKNPNGYCNHFFRFKTFPEL
ncbi:hypothetical protein TrCOL_g353 [Triparma columacea]|jgi:peptide-methionine (S)-S-oxide reductase|uniref:peptide-methionine (S)-S-oxide reductase n=1 Tax=Triparma columacea TaxID=722753 RepID=A0A9W7GII1_9STRA|nr:hypothetical protein TrCOL_g353 [Triparma columacea]